MIFETFKNVSAIEIIPRKVLKQQNEKDNNRYLNSNIAYDYQDRSAGWRIKSPA